MQSLMKSAESVWACAPWPQRRTATAAKRLTSCRIFNDRLIANILGLYQWKNFENRQVVEEGMTKNLVAYFLDPLYSWLHDDKNYNFRFVRLFFCFLYMSIMRCMHCCIEEDSLFCCSWGSFHIRMKAKQQVAGTFERTRGMSNASLPSIFV